MILTIWRHGQAGDGTPDRQRELTGSGRDDIGFGCHQFNEACRVRRVSLPHHIRYSPWHRTTQTAEIISAAFTHAIATAVDDLLPSSTVVDIDAALFALAESGATDEHVVVVSHQPLVSQLVDYYLGGDPASVPPLPPGGLATLSLASNGQGTGTLLFWAFPPEYEAGL